MTDSPLHRALDRSAVRSGLAAARRQAHLAGPLHTASRKSRVTRALRRTSARGRRAADSAAVGRLGSDLGAWADSASISAVATRGAAVVRSSWLYRWLTAEPDPDVVVIDLRETLTVAPFITAVDATVRLLLPALPRSTLVRIAERTDSALPDEPVRNASLMALGVVLVGVVVVVVRGLPDVVLIALAILAVMALVGTRIRLSWDELAETWVADLVRAALEPPEPAADPHTSDDSPDRSDDSPDPSDDPPDPSDDPPDPSDDPPDRGNRESAEVQPQESEDTTERKSGSE